LPVNRMEYLDVLDTKGNKTGETRSYDECHKKGFIHRAAHVWIMNDKNEILIQKRSKNKEAHPGLWDISAAGHVSAGQTSVEGAQREVEEEVGLKIPESDFAYLFTLENHSILNNGTFVNNEFDDVYLVKTNVDLSGIKIDPIEVEAVKFLDISAFKKWITGEGEPMVRHTEEYRRLLEHLNVKTSA
jgi:isopentenyldiphosphate isomerase